MSFLEMWRYVESFGATLTVQEALVIGAIILALTLALSQPDQ